MTGNIFMGYAMNTLFNFIAKTTNQGIILLGMLTEAIHTPFLQDRYLAIENAKYVFNNIENFSDEIEFKPNGIIQQRAQFVLNQTVEFLERVDEIGLFDAIENRMFADIARPKNGGKGFDGVIEKDVNYYNPVMDYLGNELKIKTK
jgi:beta-lysine 5,6-aminomutase alpha subunit